MTEATPEGYRGDIRPVPDPTILTQEASAKLEAMIRNLVKTEIEHQRELFDEKLDGISHQFAARISAINERLVGAANQYNEKIEKIDVRFNMLDARTAEQKQDTTNALNAALAAQKEAVAAQTASSEKSITKSETATTERIKGVETLLSTSTKATDDKITDLKDRVIAIEAVKLGNVEQASHSRGNTTTIISVIVAIIAVVSSVAAVIIALKP